MPDVLFRPFRNTLKVRCVIQRLDEKPLKKEVKEELLVTRDKEAVE